MTDKGHTWNVLLHFNTLFSVSTADPKKDCDQAINQDSTGPDSVDGAEEQLASDAAGDPPPHPHSLILGRHGRFSGSSSSSFPQHFLVFPRPRFLSCSPYLVKATRQDKYHAFSASEDYYCPVDRTHFEVVC